MGIELGEKILVELPPDYREKSTLKAQCHFSNNKAQLHVLRITPIKWNENIIIINSIYNRIKLSVNGRQYLTI